MENKKYYVIKTTELMSEDMMHFNDKVPCEAYVYSTIEAVRDELKIRASIYRESDCEWEGKDKVVIAREGKPTIILEVVGIEVECFVSENKRYDNVVGRVVYHIVIEGKTHDEFYINEESLEPFHNEFKEKLKKNGFLYVEYCGWQEENLGKRGFMNHTYDYEDGDGNKILLQVNPLAVSDKAMNIVFASRLFHLNKARRSPKDSAKFSKEANVSKENEFLSNIRNVPSERKETHNYALSFTKGELCEFDAHWRTEILGVGTADEIISLLEKNILKNFQSIECNWLEVGEEIDKNSEEFGLGAYCSVEVTGRWFLSKTNQTRFGTTPEWESATLMIEEIAK